MVQNQDNKLLNYGKVQQVDTRENLPVKFDRITKKQVKGESVGCLRWIKSLEFREIRCKTYQHLDG